MASIYSTLRWRTIRARALARDGRRCTVSRLLGGECSSGPLHVHHILAVRDGGPPYDLDNTGTSCSAHHPMWEALRRRLVEDMLNPAEPPRCTHVHPTEDARRICERRLARRHQRNQRDLSRAA